MKVLINGTAVEGLTARQERSVSVGKARADVAGTVVSAEAATAALMRWARILFTCVGAFAGILIIGIVALADAQDRWLIYPFAVVMLIVVLGIIRWGYRRTERRWQSKLPARTAALPPPGTVVRLNATGLTIGDRSVAWSDLRVSELELLLISGADDSALIVDRMLLATAGADITLDRNLMQNGAAILDNVYRLLCRQTKHP
jgi:hypothetical protein